MCIVGYIVSNIVTQIFIHRCEEGSRRKGVVNVELDVIYMNEDKLKYMEGVVSGMGNLGIRMVSCI